MKIHIDFETRSRVDVSKVGAWVYSTHPSTEILCCGYAVEDEEPAILSPGDFKIIKIRGNMESTLSCQARVLQKYAGQENTTFVAHNAGFEQAIWANIMVKRYGFSPIPLHRWRCTMAKAAAHALPQSLDKLSQVLNLSIQKDMEGHKLMLKMSKPRRPSKKCPDGGWWEDPEDIKRLCAYNRQDIETERLVDHHLRDLKQSEQKIWFIDQTINQRGFRVDKPMVDKVINLIKTGGETLLEEFEQLTDGSPKSPKQVEKFRTWLGDQGVSAPNLQKETVDALLEDKSVTGRARRALEIRQVLGQSSISKYQKMQLMADDDHIVRDSIAYHSASTGRWGGRGIQPQNFPKGKVDSDIAIQWLKIVEDFTELSSIYANPMTALSSATRGMIMAREGCRLMVADYNAIEARVVAWLANEPNLLGMFQRGEDPYVWMAAMIYRIAIEAVTKDQRFIGKNVVLGCGYQMGPEKFSSQYNVELELAEVCVATYRESNSRIVRYWTKIEETAKRAIQTGRPQTIGCLTWFTHGGFLYCKLPSGRCIAYYKPRIQEVKTPWGDTKLGITYWGMDSKTHQWAQQKTYGGKLTENVVQAIARDVMAEAMVRCEDNGYPLILTIHDELAADVPDSSDKTLKEFIDLMSIVPEWASELPIKVEGWEGLRYRK